ncbi:class I SAM-dependent methyltransferase [Rhizobium leguminosarum]|uniref:class I SAM-dependent methyltransferase n=1 Tax=Rhizobium leguminosarum TaxID=384 RepID=UPI0014417BFC|nr:class I SAM-dependent methyltransferase [Rhizobium leguminosarum]NKL63121.1 methyltransferase domain-containing protein [Rhizobium leguminosarum bv. viciae]
MSGAADYWDEHAGEHLSSKLHWEVYPTTAMFQAKLASQTWSSNEDTFAGAFLTKYGQEFRSMASICCGTGILERWLDERYRWRKVKIDGYDISEGSLKIARGLAGPSSRVQYRQSDANQMNIGNGVYDVVFAHGALHHVENLEHCLEATDRALKHGGLFYVNDYIGPSRFQWTSVQTQRANEFLAGIPDEYLARRDIFKVDPTELAEMDPSEAVRAGEIEAAVREQFDVLEVIPRGGTLLAPIFGSGCIKAEALELPEIIDKIEWLCEEEMRLIGTEKLVSDHAVIIARARRRRLWGWFST